MAKRKTAAAFRGDIEHRLSLMGYAKSRIMWQAKPAVLAVIVGDELKTFRINASRKRADVEYELGKLDTWAEVLRLKPFEAQVAKPTKQVRVAKVDPMQLDIVAAIAAAVKPNGVYHAQTA